MLEAAFARSPIAHGVIRSTDTQAAHKLPGVHAVYTLADLRSVLTADRLPLQFPSNLLPQDVGLSFLHTKKCVSSVNRLRWSSRTIVMWPRTPRNWSKSTSIRCLPFRIAVMRSRRADRMCISPKGQPVDRFPAKLPRCRRSAGSSAAILSLSLKQHRGGAHPIECRRVLANFDSIEDRLTVWLSS
jgi:carbon-monoxide dehydrogenase large subunit